MPKRARAPSVSSSSSTSSFNAEDDRQRLLALLDAQCGASTGVTSSLVFPAHESDEEEEDDDDDDDVYSSGEEEASDSQEDLLDADDEWTGITARAAEKVNGRSSATHPAPPQASTSALPSKKAKRTVSSAPVVVFDDASSSRRVLDPAQPKEKDSFMSTKIRRADATADTPS